MDRKKPPALTAPSKVGFLVALMLVVTGLGVGYFISGAFGLKWNWIEFNGASPTTWVFRLGAFIDEMVPLVALVTLLAVASHVLVAGAVRRYTRYVDSGVEYKQLLRSIKSIDDLEDEERIEQLKQHPELRDFLMGFKKRMAAREQPLNDRGKRSPAPRGAGAPPTNLPAESGILVSAILKGPAGFSGELALTIPELKQIERAAREQFACEAPPAPELETLRNRVDATVEAVKNRTSEIRRDADACAAGVREMEALVGQLKQAIETPQESLVVEDGIATAAKQLDAMAETLASLGEETRRVAIAAALQASGGGEGDPIKIAEEVRAIATRFNAVAAQWKQAGPALRAGIATLEKGTSSAVQRRKSLAATAAKAAAGAQMWGERLVALQEQIRGLERAAGAEAQAAAPREWGAIDDSLDIDVPGASDTAAPAFEPVAPRPVAPVVEAEPAAASPEEAESGVDNPPPADVFGAVGVEDEAPFADIPGLEKQQRVFRERLAARSSAVDEALAALEVEHTAGADPQLDGGSPPLVDAAPAEDATDDGFLTGPRPSEAAPREEEGATPARKRSARKPPRAAPVEAEPEVEEDGRIVIDVDSDVVDLYEIGAVDFVEGVHA